MLLLTGPPGSGKTSYLLGQIRESLRAGRQDFRLLVPTATMAEHLRNTLAREGFVFQPRLIGSLTRFVEPWAEGMPETSASCLDFLIDQALAAVSPADFEAVARFPGFRTCLARLIDELSAAGSNSSKLKAALDGTFWRSRAAASFADVFAQVERSLERRGLELPADRLRHAAARIASEGLPGIRCVFLDGFFTLSDSELLVLDAIRRHAEVCVSLPSWANADEARAGLLSMGFVERRCERLRPQPTAVVVAAGDI